MNTRKRPALSLRRIMLAQLCLLPFGALLQAQTAPAKADPAKAASANAATAKAIDAASAKSTEPEVSQADSKDIVVLTPFEVVSSTKGYYASNTMSGTRFNTKLSDLASSITVMTKEQMSDFGMLDVNDIFLYVAGTEGTGTYTDFTLDRNGSVSDNVQLNPTNANRVRGIAPANTSLGNIETMNRVPIDPITIDAIEVSRGPNANVFGLGNPSGTVNQVGASANLTRNKLSTTMRGDSHSGYRTTLDVNQVLIKNKLAIRASGVFQHDGFQRKPSGVDTERYNGMIKYQPFKYTTISASVNYYHAYGNRPNSIPPRDNISYWLSVGSPTWNPITQQIHAKDGTNIGVPITATTYNGPGYFSATFLGSDRNQMFIDQRGLSYWAAPRATTSTTTPALTQTAARYLQPTSIADSPFSGTAPRSASQFLFNTTPTVSDKNLYDWSTINLSSPNRFMDRTVTTNVTIDQVLISSAMQTFAVQATFMREDSQRWARNLIGVANDNGQSGQLTVDINEKLLDGTTNPYFLRPYISVDKPRTTSAPAKWDTYRAQVAYRIDLTKQNNFLKNLGWFQFTAYSEYKYRINRQYSYRDAISSDISWIPAGTYRGTQSAPTGFPAVINQTQGHYRFYVGDNVGNNADYAPSDFNYGTYNYNWSSIVSSVITPHVDALTIGEVAADKSGGSFNTQVTLKTVGGVVQSHLFGDRLITTMGIRQDDTFSRFGNAGQPVTNALLNADGKTFNYDIINHWAAKFVNGGRTTNIQFVVRPLADTKYVAEMGKSNSAAGRLFGDFLNGFSVNFNRSNSFLPLAPAQDLNQKILPNPTGRDKSWGFGITMFDGKLVVRATRFDNYQANAQNSDSNTMAQRVLRTDLLLTGASQANPPITLQANVDRWTRVLNPTFTDAQVFTAVSQTIKISETDMIALITPTPPIGATNDIRSVGSELEVNYNPTKFWTISASATDTKSINLNVSKALADWIATRMPLWTTIVDPTIATIPTQKAFDIVNGIDTNPLNLWWKHKYSATGQTPEQNFKAFVAAPYGVIKELEGKASPQIRRYAFRGSTNLQLAGISNNKWIKRMNVGGALRWEDKGAIGYYGNADAQGIYQSLDTNRPIYDKAHTYVDLFVGYKQKLWNDKVSASFKVNVRNLGEKGRLQAVGAFPDGTIHTYRIIDPQEFIFTASFDL